MLRSWEDPKVKIEHNIDSYMYHVFMTTKVQFVRSTGETGMDKKNVHARTVGRA